LVDEEMEVKLEAMHRMLMDQDIDIFGFTESNTSWDLLPEANRPAKQTRGWWETSHWSLTHNRTETNRKQNNTKAYQPGGASILCINQIAHCTQPPGDDTSGWAGGVGPEYTGHKFFHKDCHNVPTLLLQWSSDDVPAAI